MKQDRTNLKPRIKQLFVNSNQKKEDKDIGKSKPTNIFRIPLSIPSRPSKLVLAKSKF